MVYIICDEAVQNESPKELYMLKYGKHFSKNMCEWAVLMMHKDGGSYITKSQIDNLMENYSTYPKSLQGYDYVFLANFAKFNFLNKSIPDDMHLIQFVKDVIDNTYDGMIFNEWLHCMKEKQVEIPWESMI